MAVVPLLTLTSGNITSIASARYYHVSSSVAIIAQSTETVARTRWRAAGTWSHLLITVYFNDRTASSTIRSRVNGANGNQVASIAAGLTGTFQDSTNTDAVASGDYLAYLVTPGSGGSAFNIRCLASAFDGTSGTTVRYGHGFSTTVAGGSAAGTYYTAFVGGAGSGGWDTVVGSIQRRESRAEAGTLRNAHFYCGVNGRTASQSVGVRVNTLLSALVISIPGSTTGYFENTTDTAVVAADDTLLWSLTHSEGSGSTTQQYHIGCQFDPSGTAVPMGAIATASVATGGTTRFGTISGTTSWDATESLSTAQAPMPTGITSAGMEARSATNTIDTATTLTLRLNGASTSTQVSIPGNTTGWFGVAATQAIAALDLCDVAIVTGTGGSNIVVGSIQLTEGVAPANTAPVVDAGPDQTITLPNTGIMAGSATDDGYPNPPSALTYQWTQVSGPAPAVFTDDTSPTTVVDFPMEGVYVLELEASDSALTGSDTVTITASPEPPPCPGASPGPSICGTENVFTWIEQTQRLETGVYATRVTSDVQLNDPPDYYFGKKEARVLSFGDVTRQLSDAQGQWQGSSATWREAEVDRAFRSKFASATAYTVPNTADVVYMIKESDWRLESDARLMFIGHRLRSTPMEDMSIEHESGDALARDLTVAGKEVQCPRRTFSRTFTPEIPTALVDVPEPIVYGRMADSLSDETPPDMIADTALGGEMTDPANPVHGWAPMPGPDPVTGVAVSDSAGGSIDTGDVPGSIYFANIAGQDASGVWGDFSTYAQRDTALVPSVTLGSNGRQITVTWTLPVTNTAAIWRVALGYNFFGVRYVQYIDVDGTDTTATFDNAPSHTEFTNNDLSQVGTGASANTYGTLAYYKAAALMDDGSYTALSDNLGYAEATIYNRANRIEVDIASVPVDAASISIWKLPPGWAPGVPAIGMWSVPLTQLSAAGHIYTDDDHMGGNMTTGVEPPVAGGRHDITAYYGGQELVSYYGVYMHRWFVASHAVGEIPEVYVAGTTNYPESTLISGEIGLTFFIPGQGNYATVFGANYRDFNGRRYSVIYSYAPDAEELAEGTGTIKCNVHGVEDVGDGSGTVITHPVDQYSHWFQNFGPLGDYQSGLWLDAPDWEPIAEHCKVSAESWRDVRDAHNTAFTSTITGGGIIRDRAGMREWIARWNLSCDARLGVNAAGQWMLAAHFPDAAITATYTESRHIRQGSVRFEPLHNEHWTTIKYRYAQNAEGVWVEGDATDADEVAAYGEDRESPTFDLFFIQSPAVATYLMNRMRERHKLLPWRVTFETIDLCGTNSDLGDTIAVTGTWGLGTEGWTAFKMFLERHETLPNTQNTRLVCRSDQAPHIV